MHESFELPVFASSPSDALVVLYMYTMSACRLLIVFIMTSANLSD